MTAWSIPFLSDQLVAIQRKMDQERARHSMNNARIMDMDRAADRIADPAKRASAKRAINLLVERQARNAQRWRTLGDAWEKARQQGRAFLRSLGIPPPVGLGLVPLVPAAIVAVVLVAAAYLAKVAIENNTTARQIEANRRIIDGVLAGQLTPDEADRLMRDAARAADKGAGDPFGISEILKTAGPVLALVAAIVILPPLLERGRRAA